MKNMPLVSKPLLTICTAERQMANTGVGRRRPNGHGEHDVAHVVDRSAGHRPFQMGLAQRCQGAIEERDHGEQQQGWAVTLRGLRTGNFFLHGLLPQQPRGVGQNAQVRKRLRGGGKCGRQEA